MPRNLCCHRTVREPEPTGARRWQDRCILCGDVLGYARDGAPEPCLIGWGLEDALLPMAPEAIAALTASARRAA